MDWIRITSHCRCAKQVPLCPSKVLTRASSSSLRPCNVSIYLPHFFCTHNLYLNRIFISTTPRPFVSCVSFVSPRTRVGWPHKGYTRSGRLQPIRNGSHHRHNSTIDTHTRPIHHHIPNSRHSYMQHFCDLCPQTPHTPTTGVKTFGMPRHRTL